MIACLRAHEYSTLERGAAGGEQDTAGRNRCHYLAQAHATREQTGSQ